MITHQIQIKKWIIENKNTVIMWSALTMISGIFAYSQADFNKKPPMIEGDIDTYIPNGFVLLPIDLNNADALEGILQEKGMVDLYTSRGSHISVETVAKSVKIIRSPKNPNLFAILIPEKQASILIQRAQSFHAVVRNPKHAQTQISPIKMKRKRSIVIDSTIKEHF